MTYSLAVDLDHVLDHTRGLWRDLAGTRLFVTGGSGYLGRWMLESLAWAVERLEIDVRVVVLTRDPERAAVRMPHLTRIGWLRGDVRNFDFPAGEFDRVLHLAGEPDGPRYRDDPAPLIATVIEGAQRVLDFAVQAGVDRFLLVSSGAANGRTGTYAEAKRAAEMLATREHRLIIPIARPYAILGPFIPRIGVFAASSFLRGAICEGRINVEQPRTIRSYLYTADLAIWLWTILERGHTHAAYEVGSDQPVTLGNFAQRIADRIEPRPKVTLSNGLSAERYVPDIAGTCELGLDVVIDLDTAIDRTVTWAREHWLTSQAINDDR